MGKHIQIDQLKTVGGQSVVGEGNIEIGSVVKTDNKTISLNKDGALQLGVLDNDNYQRVVSVEESFLVFKNESSESQTKFDGTNIYISNDRGDVMTLSLYQVLFSNAEGSSYVYPGLIFITSDIGKTEIHPDRMIISSDNKSVELSPSLLEIKNWTRDVKHTFTFPDSTVDRTTTMVTSVNGQEADEKGNITLPERDYEYEKFIRSVPYHRPAIYKYDKAKMGETFGELFSPMYALFDNFLGEMLIYFIDEYRNEITQMTLPENSDEKYLAVLPPEVEGKSFYIVFPS
ncbi:hypothetical protein [Myroides odoratus]|uniref:hypothetical protein n=1 Tax=Myroides odoratus TaxID=256 RepID=UPI0039B0EFD5